MSASVQIDPAAFLRRVLEDCLQEALPIYWERRADELDAVGTEWATARAQDCRDHAAILRAGWETAA